MKSIIHLIIIIIMGFFLSTCNNKPAKHRFLPYMSFSKEMRSLGEAIYDDRAGDVSLIVTQQGLSPDTINEWGMTLLLYAIRTSSKSTVKTLLEMGADPNKRCQTLTPRANMDPIKDPPTWPIVSAVYQPDLYFVDILLKYGYDVNTGYPIHATINNAPDRNALKLIRRFIDLGSNINAYDEIHETPLINAINCGRLECANLLIDSGANIFLQDGHGNTAAYKIQIEINRCNTDDHREVYLRRTMPTIERLKARGVKFPVPKPVIEGETYWQRRERENAEQKAAADSAPKGGTNQPNRWVILDNE